MSRPASISAEWNHQLLSPLINKGPPLIKYKTYVIPYYWLNDKLMILLGLSNCFYEWSPLGGSCKNKQNMTEDDLFFCLKRELNEESRTLLNLNGQLRLSQCQMIQYVDETFHPRQGGDIDYYIRVYFVNCTATQDSIRKVLMTFSDDEFVSQWSKASYHEMLLLDFIEIGSPRFCEYFNTTLNTYHLTKKHNTSDARLTINLDHYMNVLVANPDPQKQLQSIQLSASSSSSHNYQLAPQRPKMLMNWRASAPLQAQPKTYRPEALLKFAPLEKHCRYAYYNVEESFKVSDGKRFYTNFLVGLIKGLKLSLADLQTDRETACLIVSEALKDFLKPGQPICEDSVFISN